MECGVKIPSSICFFSFSIFLFLRAFLMSLKISFYTFTALFPFVSHTFHLFLAHFSPLFCILSPLFGILFAIVWHTFTSFWYTFTSYMLFILIPHRIHICYTPPLYHCIPLPYFHIYATHALHISRSDFFHLLYFSSLV